MAMAEPIAMPTNTPSSADILTLTQWFSPAYPVGAFAYSHGLEWAVDAGDVDDHNSTKDWITDAVQYGSGWSDALFLVAAYQAQQRAEIDQIDTSCKAFAASAERLKETQLQGQAFCQITGSVWGHSVQEWTYPVAVGHAAKLQNLPLPLTTELYLQSFMANLVAAAMRLVPLGQTDGQRMIRDLTPLCAEIASSAQTAGLGALAASAFLTDIAAMRHETQYSRMFRT